MVSKSVLAERIGINAERHAETDASRDTESERHKWALLRSDGGTSTKDTASSTAVAGISLAGGAVTLSAGAIVGGTGGLVGIAFGGTMMLFGLIAAILPRRN